jgi:hypothetical protein
MRSFIAWIYRPALSSILIASLTGATFAQEGAAPSGAAPAPSAQQAAAAPSAPAAPQTASPPPVAAPAAPEHADMLYATDNGLMDAYTAGSCGTCGGDCGGTCGSCGDFNCGSCCPPRFWASVEALSWWQKGQFVQPLVTTSPPGTAQALAGVLGADTTVLLGDQILDYDAAIGGRFTIGHWLDDSEEHAILGRYWVLGNSTFDRTFTSDGTNILAIPFVNVDIGAEDARLVGFPNATQGTFSGDINVHAISQFNGGDVLLRTPIYRDCVRRWDLVAGYMFSRQDETLDINSLTFVSNAGNVDTTVAMFDQFATSNEFHGGVLGLSIQRSVSCYTLDILAKCAFGDMRQTTVINGGTTTVTGAGTTVDNFGLFAQSTNIGTLVDNHFCVVPEVNLNIGYYVCPCLKLYAGYTFIYWSSVARPGDQLDRLINTTFQGPLPVGDPRPDHSTVLSHNTWVQGVNVGLEYRF